ncbi:MAG: hypothetical protein KDC38_08055 [Planctomycetes bacterium]|nr:hypothetical protein [Planctomycetota bacterium]
MRRTIFGIAGIAISAAILWAAVGTSVWAGGPTSGDTNGDGSTDIGDVIYLLDHLFSGGPAPVPVDCPGGPIDIEDANAALRARAMSDLQGVGSSFSMSLDPDTLEMMTLPGGIFATASIAELPLLQSPIDYVGGKDVAVCYVGWPIPGGAAPLPAGFYRHRIEVDLAAYTAGDPQFASTYLVDTAGNLFPLPTFSVHFSGSSVEASLGVRSDLCDETTVLKARRYVSCPQLGDLLAMTCIESTLQAPTLP